MGNTFTKAKIETEDDLDEKSRIETARKYDLPDTATWNDITITTGEINIKEFTKQKGLPKTATWAEINTAGENTAKN
jgi:hypothetical protein